MAARSENIEILKKTTKKVILIDRFTDSTIAYQHYGLGVNLQIINKINYFLLKNFRPDFTFLHTVNIRNMFLRLKIEKISIDMINLIRNFTIKYKRDF